MYPMNDAGSDTPEPTPEYLDDSTLGGYFETHDRPPAFEGSDGHPYTVSIEIERTGDLRQPYCGYLVFPRWAETGVGIIGHVETDTLSEARSEDEVRTVLHALTLYDVQDLLEDAIAARRSDVDD